MSDRWQRELSKINRAQLGTDLWDRILEGPRLDPTLDRARSRAPAVAVALAVFAAAFLFIWASFRAVSPSPGPLAGSNLVDVPPRGETAAVFLGDGRPVFVAHHVDGTVTVLDGFSPTRDWGIRQLVAWCTSKPYFLTWPDGSFFDRSGGWLGGTPAAPGLGAYSFEIQAREANGDPSLLLIGDLGTVLPHGHDNLSTMRSYASACGLADGSDAQVVVHSVGSSQIWESPLAAVGADPPGWFAVRGTLHVGEKGSVRMCSSIGGGCRDGVPVTGLDGRGLSREIDADPASRYARSHIWIAVTNGTAIVDVAIADDLGSR
jgi:hypothetical protein